MQPERDSPAEEAVADFSSSRKQRVAEIVEAAVERPLAERAGFLDEACAGDVDLRREVQSLLAFQNDATDFIEKPAYEIAGAKRSDFQGELKSGDQIDDYKIISQIGEGGMGEVYLAEDLKLGRKIAIKLLKLGLGTANIVRRFRQEERILAGLLHPNIAQLYGGGVATNGLPYFVMEYVDGPRLDDYCRERFRDSGAGHLSILEQLGSFRKICSAVAYAHQRLVIHRDLKPANIRVAADGEPKLLDFGIAKLLDPATTTPEMTMTFAPMMTPEYASPEQIRGENMTTATDVYSLGVLLYELLTGIRPYRLKTRNATGIARAIAEQEPIKPSLAVAEEIPTSKIDRRRSLKGDLDNIVLKALRKEPERRYGSVTELSDDIRRYIEGLPVTARKDTLGYRTAKFIARHRISVAAAVLMVLILASGVIAVGWEANQANQQRARAEHRFNEVRRLANSLLFEMHDAIQNLPGSTAARELLVKRALQYLDSLARESGNDLSLQRELAAAYVRTGNVQGNPNNANLGDTSGALESYRHAQRINDEILAANPGDSEARRALAINEEKMSDVQAAMGKIGAAVETARKSLAIFKALAKANPANLRAQRSVAISYMKTGDVLGNSNFPNAGNNEAAMANYQASSEIVHALYRANPNNVDLGMWLGRIYERIGTILEQQGKIDAAKQSYGQSQLVRERLAKRNPQNADAVRDLAVAHEKMGNVMTAVGDLNAALEHRNKSLQIFKQLAIADPNNAQAQLSLAISYIHLGDLLGYPGSPNLGRRDEARENYQHAIDILQRAKNFGSTDAKVQTNLDLLRDRIRQL